MAQDEEQGKHEVPEFVQTARAQIEELDNWQQITEQEARTAYDMTLRNELSGGTPTVREFERRWRERCGLDYAITTVNGTSALYSAFFGLGVGPGDEVICPSFTWIGSIAPALFLGARPVFCESGERTMLLDPEDVRRRITPNTRAIVAVHLWGWVCDLDAIMAISRETGVPVIEDCSHAHGATYKGRWVGSYGQVACWSLQGSKPVSAGESGILATNDPEIFDRACLAGQVNRIAGVDLAQEKYRYLQPLGLGMKFRAHPLGVGIASVQLDKLDELNARRGQYVAEVEAGLAAIPGLEPIPMTPGSQRGGYYGFPLRYVAQQAESSPIAKVIEAINRAGVPATTCPYELLHRLPLFAQGFDLFGRGRGPLSGDYRGYREGDLPVTEKLVSELIFLPVLSDPIPGAADLILQALREAMAMAPSL
ncbi:MAG: DegT/DnrJ/EryC1/StrS family aminotransferase [Anaerolineae bacterium]|nr:DegT/DnrJ/EryC1/StrS family aminotransferase [Anaerolineae bacterium]